MSTTAVGNNNNTRPLGGRHRNTNKASIVTPGSSIVEISENNDSTMGPPSNSGGNTTSINGNNTHGHSSSGNHHHHQQQSSSVLPARTISYLRSAGIAHPQQQCVLTCYIPPSRVGAVIGRRGTTIIHVQREAVKKSWGHGGQVRVSIVSQGSGNGGTASPSDGANSESFDDIPTGATSPDGTRDFDGGKRDEAAEEASLWTPVIIRGDPCGAIAAAKLLLPLLTPASVHADGNDGNEVDNAADMDDVVLDVPIHRARHAAIIGKKGLTIAALSADHNVRIMVPHRNQSVHDKSPSSNSAAASPNNINVVQLEGQLENVEKCLASMLKVVCGTHSPNIISNTNTNGDFVATEVIDLKPEVSNNIKTTNDPPHTDPTSPPETSDTPKLNITITSNQNSTSKKELKFLEQTITVPPELSYLVPSLAKIRSIGKSTSSVIRRKRLNGALNDNSNTAITNGIADEITGQEKTESGDDVAVSTFNTQLIVNGRTEAVKNAVAQLEKMLTPSLAAGDVSSEKQYSKISENTAEEKQQDTGKQEDNENGSSLVKRKEGVDITGEHVRQKNSSGKRRSGGRGGGRIGNKGGKKRGGRGGRGESGSGNRDGAVATAGSASKE